MANPLPPLLIATRGSDGVAVYNGPPAYGQCNDFSRDPSKSCRSMQFSKDGKVFAWCNGQHINAVSVPNFRSIFQTEQPRTGFIQLSPKASMICAWEPYTTRKDNTNTPNLRVWNIKTGQCLLTLFQKKPTNWHPQWTDNEEVCARMVNNEVHFFEKNNFETISKKIYQQKIADFSLAPGPAPHHVACYSPGSKGQPSFVRLYCYPRFEGNSAAIANKSFFKADKVNFVWNSRGSAVLLLLSCEIDKTGASYYGEQALHFIATNGDTAIVKLAKDGPIYSTEWSPKSDQFCVLYGFMPAKATLFNLKCETVFDFGTGPRNQVIYSPKGNLLILAGFGNLQGNVEVWDFKNGKQAGQMKASNTTHLEWCPDNEHILTATTAPRLRVGNGYKVWHYTGPLLVEKSWPDDLELWEAFWQPIPNDRFPSKPIQYQPVGGIKAAQPQRPMQVYRPPAAKGQPSKFKVRDEYEKPSNQKDEPPIDQAKALKNKKKRDARKAKKELEKQQGDGSSNGASQYSAATTNLHVTLTGDLEKDKKIRNLLKKLDQIAKIKEQQKDGKQVELNQVEKMQKEEEFIRELQQLQI